MRLNGKMDTFGAAITELSTQETNSNTGPGIILTKEWGQMVKNNLLYRDSLCLLNLKEEDILVIIDIHANFWPQR
jgi:hypothetical protein